MSAPTVEELRLLAAWLPATSGATVDGRYVSGRHCTWHGGIALAGRRPDDTACCPVCGGDVVVLPSRDAFWLGVWLMSAMVPGLEALVSWGEGLHFDNGGALQAAYRLAMEDQPNFEPTPNEGDAA